MKHAPRASNDGTDFSAYHPIQAREALGRALHAAKFGAALEEFARAHRPPAFLLGDAAVRSPGYADALRRFAESWGLPSQWFREFCHDFAWRFCGGSPRRLYMHTLPAPFARLDIVLESDLTVDALRTGNPRVAEVCVCSMALWPHETRPAVRARLRAELLAMRRLLDDAMAAAEQQSPASIQAVSAPTPAVWARLRFVALDGDRQGEARSDKPVTFPPPADRVAAPITRAFDELWQTSIKPTRQAYGAPLHARGLDKADRDAQLFVARALARNDREHDVALVAATIENVDRIWPGTRDRTFDEESAALPKLLTQFGHLLDDGADQPARI